MTKAETACIAVMALCIGVLAGFGITIFAAASAVFSGGVCG